MAVTAKFKVNRVEKHGDGDYEYRHIRLTAVYSPDPNSPNYSWSKMTPCGEIAMTITNPAAFQQFELEQEFLLTFVPAN